MSFLEIVGLITLVGVFTGFASVIVETNLPTTAVLSVYRTVIGVLICIPLVMLIERWKSDQERRAGIPSEQKPLE